MRGFSRILLIALCLQGYARALYLGSSVTALQVDNGRITVDGKPDEMIWKEIAARHRQAIQIPFNDYPRIVLLDSVSIRNADPRKHYDAPSTGAVSLLAAYDTQNLYFLFLVKENNAFSPVGPCTPADLWRAHAADLFLDTTAWDPELVPALFSRDASGLTNGTSRGSLQVAKPTQPQDARVYYRDRSQNDRFEMRAAPAALKAVSTARSGDNLNYAIEMSIPYNRNVNPVGKSMFISWGYNHYPEGDRATCGRNPIAYRWAKHYKTYGADDEKPPGWRAGDTTHYDPTRSWDGWGRLDLSTTKATGLGMNCRSGHETAPWDPRTWTEYCAPPVSVERVSPRRLPGSVPPGFAGAAFDVRGRRIEPNPSVPGLGRPVPEG